ncbi:MAG: competence protein ComK [Sedimentibacter sp.]|uniref:competence protein ComK n=1 Tax=Sedimentibacter sp. TaxID=1960295 RepID=UPI00298154EF|nr:competence protein ComK [Sedimentibacter sp.]MDW5298665.1 competence protein ComK [Sedimentibacter sp.]
MKNDLKFNVVEAMLPVYVKEQGNSTEIITSECSFIRNATIETCIKNMADYYNLSLYHNRLNYGEELGITNKVPIAINENLVFIYINVREPLFKHDAAYGVIDVNAIEQVFLKAGNAAILTKSGRIITTRQSIKSVKKSMLNGRLAKDIYKEKHKK